MSGYCLMCLEKCCELYKNENWWLTTLRMTSMFVCIPIYDTKVMFLKKCVSWRVLNFGGIHGGQLYFMESRFGYGLWAVLQRIAYKFHKVQIAPNHLSRRGITHWWSALKECDSEKGKLMNVVVNPLYRLQLSFKNICLE